MNFENPSIKVIFIVNLLIVFFFAIIYIIIGSFGNQFNHTSKTLNLLDAIYLSMTIQSSVGFGDITPKTKVAKFFVLIQQSLTLLNISFPSFKFLQDSLSNKKSTPVEPGTLPWVSLPVPSTGSAPSTGSGPVQPGTLPWVPVSSTSPAPVSTPVSAPVSAATLAYGITPAPVSAPVSAPVQTTAPSNIISKYSSYNSSKINDFLKKVESKR